MIRVSQNDDYPLFAHECWSVDNELTTSQSAAVDFLVKRISLTGWIVTATRTISDIFGCRIKYMTDGRWNLFSRENFLSSTVLGGRLWKRFCKMYSESCPLLALAAAVQPNCLWNSQKTFYKTFFTTCRPRLYATTVLSLRIMIMTDIWKLSRAQVMGDSWLRPNSHEERLSW